MNYNKKAHLKTNTEAIRIAFTLDREKRRVTEAEREILQQYSGFGGIKCILNPAEKESDKGYRTKTDMELFPTVSDLHRLIRENSKDEQEYKRCFSSLKSSAEEQAFIKTRTLSNGININSYFQDFSRVIHTKSGIDKDLYGKPGPVFIHEGRVQGMADDPRRMLSDDFSKNPDKNRYAENSIQTHRLYQPTAQDRQEMGAMTDEAERQSANGHLPQPEDSENISPEDMEEIEAALEAVRKGKRDEFVAARPYMTGSAQKPEEKPQAQPEAKPQQAEPAPAASRQPVMSLYDLFGFSEEERKQLNTQKRGKKKPAPKQGQSRQLNLFSQSKPQPETVKNSTDTDNNQTKPVYPVLDARKEEPDRQQRELQKPRPCPASCRNTTNRVHQSRNRTDKPVS